MVSYGKKIYLDLTVMNFLFQKCSLIIHFVVIVRVWEPFLVLLTGYYHKKWNCQIKKEITKWIFSLVLTYKIRNIVSLPSVVIYMHLFNMGEMTKMINWERSVKVSVPGAANFQVFIYLRSYQRQLLYKEIFWTCAYVKAGPLSNHKGLLWTCRTCPFMTLVGEEFIYFLVLL